MGGCLGELQLLSEGVHPAADWVWRSECEDEERLGGGVRVPQHPPQDVPGLGQGSCIISGGHNEHQALDLIIVQWPHPLETADAAEFRNLKPQGIAHEGQCGDPFDRGVGAPIVANYICNLRFSFAVWSKEADGDLLYIGAIIGNAFCNGIKKRRRLCFAELDGHRCCPHGDSVVVLYFQIGMKVMQDTEDFSVSLPK